MSSNLIVSQIKPVLLKYGVTRSDIFGSFARGDYNDKSDVDLLVDVPRGTSLFDLGYLQEDLEKALNREVDLVSYNFINKHVKKYIFENTLKVI